MYNKYGSERTKHIITSLRLSYFHIRLNGFKYIYVSSVKRDVSTFYENTFITIYKLLVPLNGTF